MVEKMQIESDHDCGDVDTEARLKLLIEMQQAVQGFVVRIIAVLDIHESLTKTVDELISSQLE